MSLVQDITTMIPIFPSLKESHWAKKQIKPLLYTPWSLDQVSMKVSPKDQCLEPKLERLKGHSLVIPSLLDLGPMIANIIQKKELLKLEPVQEIKWTKAIPQGQAHIS